MKDKNNFDSREIYPGVFKTFNKMGYMFNYLSEYGEEFIKSCEPGSIVLDIAAAFGTSTIEALKKNAIVYANDMDVRHLDILQQRVPGQFLKNLTLCPGKFPEDLDFESDFFDFILFSHALHFLHPQEVDQALKKVYQWLKPGGKLFIITATPFEGHVQNFIPAFEESSKTGDAYAGYVSKLDDYCTIRLDDLPSSMLFFDIKTIIQAFSENHFLIEKVSYVSRPDFPQDMQLDGRENIGVVALKPV